jgi:hypothetical protein
MFVYRAPQLVLKALSSGRDGRFVLAEVPHYRQYTAQSLLFRTWECCTQDGQSACQPPRCLK